MAHRLCSRRRWNDGFLRVVALCLLLSSVCWQFKPCNATNHGTAYTKTLQKYAWNCRYTDSKRHKNGNDVKLASKLVWCLSCGRFGSLASIRQRVSAHCVCVYVLYPAFHSAWFGCSFIHSVRLFSAAYYSWCGARCLWPGLCVICMRSVYECCPIQIVLAISIDLLHCPHDNRNKLLIEKKISWTHRRWASGSSISSSKEAHPNWRYTKYALHCVCIQSVANPNYILFKHKHYSAWPIQEKAPKKRDNWTLQARDLPQPIQSIKTNFSQ